MKPLSQAEKGEEARLAGIAAAAETQLKGARERAAAVECAIAEVKELVVNAGGDEMKRAKQAATRAQKAVDEAESELSSSEAKIKAAKKKLTDFDKKENTLKEEMETGKKVGGEVGWLVGWLVGWRAQRSVSSRRSSWVAAGSDQTLKQPGKSMTTSR